MERLGRSNGAFIWTVGLLIAARDGTHERTGSSYKTATVQRTEIRTTGLNAVHRELSQLLSRRLRPPIVQARLLAVHLRWLPTGC